eukprot:gnl/MRDRNA2_/MRDRNA2_83543_c0_seq3.p1 gnl/MRDRNA2_/MRDRNA2_83543_c0~~gnl/MRDRNA2_/MRDRNA2_83543_c0_seq3.p1  ORF type:complete len:158 (-),score=3.10 gnl/MRDRNA2_/MRDRNA2_83543_c0_seq3:64-537(-)
MPPWPRQTPYRRTVFHKFSNKTLKSVGDVLCRAFTNSACKQSAYTICSLTAATTLFSQPPCVICEILCIGILCNLQTPDEYRYNRSRLLDCQQTMSLRSDCSFLRNKPHGLSQIFAHEFDCQCLVRHFDLCKTSFHVGDILCGKACNTVNDWHTNRV